MTTSSLIKSGLSYYPIRLMICSFVISFIFFKADVVLGRFEKQMLVDMLHFFSIPSYYYGDSLFVGHSIAPINIIPPIETQIIFLVFFFSTAIVTSTSTLIRARISFYGLITFFVFIITEFLVIVLLLLLGFTDYRPYAQWGIIGTGIVGGLLIELMLFKVITLPQKTKPRKLIRRSYMDEYAFLALVLAGATLITYICLNVIQVKAESPAATYLALSFSNILALKYYVAYFIYEIKSPRWISWLRHSTNSNANSHLSASFLLPAYNEGRSIVKCIESIDVAAFNYPGKTEIVIINDGSTDNTEKLATDAIKKLKNCTGNVYTIKNSGQGFALSYGLQLVTGEVIFRIDTDSTVDRNSIHPIMNHFRDPAVGSVSGVIFSADESSIWQKSMTMLFCLFIFNKRGHQLLDSIMTQPGAFSVFRKDALLKVGGWAKNQLGEDGDITLRLARAGYKNEFEERSLAYSEAPRDFKELTEQRIRWGVGYFHARGRNIEILKESTGPRKVILLLNLMSNGGGFAMSIFWPYLAAALLSGTSKYTTNTLAALLGIPLSLVAIDLLTTSLLYVQYIYLLIRFKKSYLIKYLPFMRLYHLILGILVNPQTIAILLEWSGKYRDLNEKSYFALKKMIKQRG